MYQCCQLLATLAATLTLLLTVHGTPQQPIPPPPPRSAKCQEFLDSIPKDSKCFSPVTAIVDEFGKLDVETGSKTFPAYYRRFLDAYCKPECNKPHENLVTAAIANCEEIANGWRAVEFISSAGKDAQQARLDWARNYQLATRDLMCMRDPTDSSKMCSPELLNTARQYQLFNNSVYPQPSEPMAVMYGLAANNMLFAWKESLLQPSQENITDVPPEAFCTPCRAAGLTQAALHRIQEFTTHVNTSAAPGWPTVAEHRESWEQQSSTLNKYCEVQNIKNPSKAAVFRTDVKVTIGLPANESIISETPSNNGPAGGNSGNKKPNGSSSAAVVQVGAVKFAIIMLALSASLL